MLSRYYNQIGSYVGAGGRLRHWIEVTTKFATVQAVVQLIGFGSGILIVRMMTIHEYAYYTIANSMQGVMSLLADMGIGIAVASIGGRVWRDRVGFGQVIQTAIRLRYWLAFAAAAVVSPFFLYLLRHQEASISYSLLLLAVVLSTLTMQLSTSIFIAAPRFHSEVGRLQLVDLVSALGRLALILVACAIWINSAVVLVIASLVTLFQFLVFRRRAAELADLNAGVNREYRGEMVRIVKGQAVNAVYYCFQGQITVWIISTFGKAKAVAEVGALGRLAMIFAVVASAMNGVILPRFASCHDPKILLRRYWQIMGACLALVTGVLLAAWLFAPQFLWLLGKQYSGLEPEFYIMVVSTVLAFMAGTMWSLNSARAWTRHSWSYMPATIVVQIVLVMALNVSTVSGALLFGLYSTIPFLLLNILMTYQGFHSIESRP